MTTRLLVFTVLAALLFLRAFPQNIAKASIEGTVGTGTGRLLRGSRITLNKVDARGSGTETNIASAVTDDKGHFLITGVDAGSYRIAAESFGFTRQEFGQRNPGGRGVLISLQAGQALTTDFQLVPASVISGRVLDAQGQAVAGAQVQLHTYQYINGRRSLMPAFPYSTSSLPSVVSAFTNDLGEYRMFWLAPGEYYVSVTGRTEASGSPTIDLGNRPSREPPFFGGTTDRVLPQTFALIYYPDTADIGSAVPVKVGASSEVKGIDFTWRPTRLPNIRGRVIVSGAAPAVTPSEGLPARQSQSSSLFLTHLDGSRVQVTGQGGRTESGGSAGTAEVFEIRGVPRGSYYLNEDMRQNGISYFGRTRVDVGDSDVNDVTVTVQPTLNIQGKIVLRSPVPPSLRMERLGVQISPTDLLGLRTSSIAAAEDGGFTLKEIAPVRYKLSVNGLPANGYIATAMIGPTDVMTKPFVVGDPSATLRLEIGFSVGRVTGSVFDSRNAASSSSVVTLIPDDPLRDRLDLHFNTSSDANGRFDFNNVPAGNYRVFAWEQIPQGAHQSVEFMRIFEGRGTSIRVEEGATKDVRVSLIP